MDLPTQPTTDFAIRGPLDRADLPGLCSRVCQRLEEADGGMLLCDVRDVRSDAVAVDALARLALGARRHRCQVRLVNADPALVRLIDFMGLGDVLGASS